MYVLYNTHYLAIFCDEILSYPDIKLLNGQKAIKRYLVPVARSRVFG